MSKRKFARMESGESGDRVLAELSTGYVVECLPIQAKIDALGRPEDSADLPEIPTYSVTDAAGVTVNFPHTLETIGREKTPQEERDAWARYQVALAQARERHTLHTLRIIALRGIRFDMPADEEWVEEHRFLYGDVPEAPHERRWHFVRTEVMGSEGDWAAVFAGVLKASGASQEVLDNLEAGFRSAVGRGERPDAGEAAPADEQRAAG